MTEKTKHERLLIGHLYAKPNGKLIFTLECKLCERVCHDWPVFAEHFRCKHFKGDEISKHGQRSKELATIVKPEMVLIADENEVFLKQEKSGGDDEFDSEVLQHCEVKLETAAEDLDVEQAMPNEEYLSSLVIVPFELDKSDEAKSEEHEKEVAKEEDVEDNSSEESELQCTIVLPKHPIASRTTNSNTTSDPKPTRQVYLPRRNIKQNPTKTPRKFYNLRDTEPKIMLHFIKLIQIYPCHWDVNDEHYGTRMKRQESASLIARELKKYWHINATTTSILASITSILRWYEKEFQRLQEPLAEPTQYIKYYEALARFLVKEHLKNFVCSECQRAFRTQNQLRSHKHLVHNAAAPFKCSHCDRTFAYESLKRHHENRHTLKESFPCNKCQYRAPNKTDLHMHMTTHTDVRAFICDECGASYKSSTSLNVHKRTHGAPRFTCGHCGKGFYENYRFKCHLRLHGREDNPLQCKVCQIELPTRYAVKEHMRINHNVIMKNGKIDGFGGDWWKDEFDEEDEDDEAEEEDDEGEDDAECLAHYEGQADRKRNDVIVIDGRGQVVVDDDDEDDVGSMDFDDGEVII